MPDEDSTVLVRLHDLLHTGLLAGELRLNLPFIPHVAVADTPKPQDCSIIVDAINAKPFEVRGQAETLEVIGYDGNRVWTLERIPLGRAGYITFGAASPGRIPRWVKKAHSAECYIPVCFFRKGGGK